MEIFVIGGKGEGNTLLSSFDSALKDTGVHNYNLLLLSSVIPPETIVHTDRKFISLDNQHGHKLYVVAAEERSNKCGEYIGSGLGWYQLEDGRGVFVEHHGKGINETDLEKQLFDLIENSIKDLCNFRNWDFKKDNMFFKTSITKVGTKPTCSLVLAVYKAEGWE